MTIVNPVDEIRLRPSPDAPTTLDGAMAARADEIFEKPSNDAVLVLRTSLPRERD